MSGGRGVSGGHGAERAGVTPRVLVVQHEPICPPGRLGGWLDDAGLALDIVRPSEGERLPDRLGHDALVVLGGTMGAYDDAQHPWLTGTKQLLADAVRTGVPTLGVCLGHQLLAVATGGRVERNAHGSTVGITPVRLLGDPAAAADEVTGRAGQGALALHWNDDVVVEPPPAAVVLARTGDGHVQAMRVGGAAWGVQFHPEADLEVASTWARRAVASGELTAARADEVVAGVVATDDRVVETWQAWAGRFAAVVRSRAGD